MITFDNFMTRCHKSWIFNEGMSIDIKLLNICNSITLYSIHAYFQRNWSLFDDCMTIHYVSIVSTASCCHFFLNNWRNAHRIIIRVYIWIYHTLLWLEIIFQSEWTLFDIKTIMLYLSYRHYVLKVINNWWRRD